MPDDNEQKFFTREETFAEVIESLFSVRHGGFRAVIKVVVGIMSIGWLGDSILPFIYGAALKWSKNAEINFTDDIYKLIFAFVGSGNSPDIGRFATVFADGKRLDCRR